MKQIAIITTVKAMNDPHGISAKLDVIQESISINYKIVIWKYLMLKRYSQAKILMKKLFFM